jgi:HSP20 family protein
VFFVFFVAAVGNHGVEVGVTKSKRNLPGLVILHGSFLNDGDQIAEGAMPLVPPVDLYETADCYVLNAELPGVDSDSIHVEVRGAELSIWGERKVDACCSEENYHRLEGIRGRFHRTFLLPEVMDADARIHAALKDGVLHVELSKSTQTKNINIQSGRAGR